MSYTTLTDRIEARKRQRQLRRIKHFCIGFFVLGTCLIGSAALWTWIALNVICSGDITCL